MLQLFAWIKVHMLLFYFLFTKCYKITNILCSLEMQIRSDSVLFRLSLLAWNKSISTNKCVRDTKSGIYLAAATLWKIRGFFVFKKKNLLLFLVVHGV